MKKMMLLFVFAAWSLTGSAQESHNNKTVEQLKENNFYFFSQLLQNAEVSQHVLKSRKLQAWTENQKVKLESQADVTQIITADQLITPYLFTKEEMVAIVSEFQKMSKHKDVKKFVQSMRDSGKYANLDTANDDSFLAEIVRLNLEGINHTLNVYGKGLDPFYPKIDAVSYEVTSNYYKRTLLYWSSHLLENGKDISLFFERSLDYALYLMYFNHRDEGVRYESLDEQYNAKAIDYAKEVDFGSYPYNALLVLGDGPANYRDPLSALGKLNLEIAVAQYRQKKAPFILVSGGHVHPNRTATCEAIVMKDELMKVYGIPEKAIIVEPYARHTTTNLRNATRLMLRYGFNIKQKSMIVSHYNHIRMIYDAKFKQRFVTELGYLPGEFIEIENGELLEYYPVEVMTQINPLEPLDP
ncbi:YdcF family protein [Myroides sp. NP-2]|uniref:YdcF family protein n=1 Tax=Myroides sp. NP-2 TaxID=2759945 RepID=UPI0015FB3F6E|nr:YdcF family protein [Myroides sp. NP-2]MBB1151171.1 YdcF family protein [Myroides sp. NP-2]